MIGIEREYIRFQKDGEQLVEHRFRSSMNWSKNDRFYALASDPVAIERCKQQALKTLEDRASESASSNARWERYRPKEAAMPALVVEEPSPPAPPPARRFMVPPVRRRPPMPSPVRKA